MNSSNLNVETTTRIIIGAAVVLIISCFLPWYEVQGGLGDFFGEASGSSSSDAFSIRGITGFLLVILGLIALVLAFRIGRSNALLSENSHRLGIVGAGVLALLVVTFNLVSPPEVVTFGASIGETKPAFGAWVSLVALLVIAGMGSRLLGAGK